jgi:hypothetical protein
VKILNSLKLWLSKLLVTHCRQRPSHRSVLHSVRSCNSGDR